jgi:hypothetical protein
VIEIVDDGVPVRCHGLCAYDRYTNGDGNTDDDDTDDDEQYLLLAHALPPSDPPMRSVFRITPENCFDSRKGARSMPSRRGETIAKILEKIDQLAVCLRAVLKILQSTENITLLLIRFLSQDDKAT